MVSYMESADVSQQVLQVDGVGKAFGAHIVVHPTSLSVARRQVVGLLGVNGAGKTTIINMVLGILSPSGGRIVVAGLDLAQARAQALRQMNFAAIYAPLPGNLTVQQNLRVFGMLYGIDDLRERVEALLHEFDLVRFRHTKCGALSSGEQTRAALAKAMLNQPRLLLLDEPTASLDPATAEAVRQKIRNFADQSDSGVLWTSHNMAEVERVCDWVLILAGGRIVMRGTPQGLVRAQRKPSLEAVFMALARDGEPPAGDESV